MEGSISKIQGGLVVTLATPSKVKHMAPVNRPFYTLQLLFETIFCKTSIFCDISRSRLFRKLRMP